MVDRKIIASWSMSRRSLDDNIRRHQSLAEESARLRGFGEGSGVVLHREITPSQVSGWLDVVWYVC